jgi:hypothetical protein
MRTQNCKLQDYELSKPAKAEHAAVPKLQQSKVPFYYGTSARFTSNGKLYVDFDHMFRTVVLPHNLASAAYMQWIKSGEPQTFMCFDFGILPTEHTSSTPFNVCAHHEKCKEKAGRNTPCSSCHSPVPCSSKKACIRLVEQRKEAFHAAWVAYSREEKIATCTDFWDYLFAGEEKLPKEHRSLTQKDMLMRIWKQRPKALFFLKHVFNPAATPEGVINLV